MKKRYNLWEVGRQLTATAQGRLKADLVIKNGTLVNVFTGEIQPNIDVVVKFGRIALVGDAAAVSGEETLVVIPEIRVTDKGIVNVNNNSLTTLFVE